MERSVAERDKVLRVPDVAPQEFERNLILTAVCEFRFPTLLELQSRPPEELQKTLRKEYPFYDTTLVSETTGQGPVEHYHQHQFRSKDRKWTVIFKASSLALETTAYSSFDDLEQRFDRVLQAASPLLDADFFTRIGLRYINVLPVEQAQWGGWINSQLVAPLLAGIYGRIEGYWQEVRGRAETGQYNFRHGRAESDTGQERYVLDFDFYDENIETAQALPRLRELNVQSFRFFMWSIGPEAIKYLGVPQPKRGGAQ